MTAREKKDAQAREAQRVLIAQALKRLPDRMHDAFFEHLSNGCSIEQAREFTLRGVSTR